MEYTRLGNTGMKVSRICLGCMGFGDTEHWVHKWVLDEENSRPIIQKALELGINFFDTANAYSLGVSEEILGRALKDFAKRDEVVIATKVHGKMREGPNGGGLSRKAILSEIDASLKRLGTDYVKLYQIHRCDYETPIEETMEALNDVVRAGKARQIVLRVAEIAKKHGCSRTQIAMAWLLQKQPVTAPIVGATKITHLEEAAGALSVKLTHDEASYLEEPYVPHQIVGHQ